MVQDSLSRKLPQYMIRFSEDLRDQLKEYANKNHRSLNGEIVQRLEQSLLIDVQETKDVVAMLSVIFRGDNPHLDKLIDQLCVAVNEK